MGKPIKVMIRGEFCRVFRLSRVSPTGDPLRNLSERTSGTRKLSTSSPSSFYSLMRVLLPRRPLGIYRWLVCLETVCVSAPPGNLQDPDSSAAVAGSGVWELLEEEGIANESLARETEAQKEQLQWPEATAAPGDGTQPKEKYSSEKQLLGGSPWWHPFFCLFPLRCIWRDMTLDRIDWPVYSLQAIPLCPLFLTEASPSSWVPRLTPHSTFLKLPWICFISLNPCFPPKEPICSLMLIIEIEYLIFFNLKFKKKLKIKILVYFSMRDSLS